MSKVPIASTPSYDRFRIVRLCRKIGLPFHELINSRIVKASKKGNELKKLYNR